MRPSPSLLSTASRITLFSHPQCSLCVAAKGVLKKVQTKRPFKFDQINIHEPDQKKWYDHYMFDVPVIHVEKANSPLDDKLPSTQKLMHRFTEQQVEDLLNNTEKS